MHRRQFRSGRLVFFLYDLCRVQYIGLVDFDKLFGATSISTSCSKAAKDITCSALVRSNIIEQSIHMDYLRHVLEILTMRFQIIKINSFLHLTHTFSTEQTLVEHWTSTLTNLSWGMLSSSSTGRLPTATTFAYVPFFSTSFKSCLPTAPIIQNPWETGLAGLAFNQQLYL